MERDNEDATDVSAARTSSLNAIEGTAPDELMQSAYHEAGHVVAEVGLLGEACYRVVAFAEPTLTHDRRGREITAMGFCETSFASVSPELQAQTLMEFPEARPQAFVRAVNRVSSLAAGPFAQAKLRGQGDWFDENDFPPGGEVDLEHSHNALLPFYDDDGERRNVLGCIWRRTGTIMRQPKMWAAVEDVADALIELDGRAPLDGGIVHSIIGRHLQLGRFRKTPIVRVKWNGEINRSLIANCAHSGGSGINSSRISTRKSVPDAEGHWSGLNSSASGMTNPERS